MNSSFVSECFIAKNRNTAGMSLNFRMPSSGNKIPSPCSSGAPLLSEVGYHQTIFRLHHLCRLQPGPSLVVNSKDFCKSGSVICMLLKEGKYNTTMG